MRIIFVNRYFWPDHSATSQMAGSLATALAAEGHEVLAIASRLHYAGDGKPSLSKTETHNGIRVHRVWTTRFGRGRLIGRAMDYLSFYISATYAVRRLAGAGDLVVAKTDPPMLGIPIGWAARRRRAKTINWLQDLFPEVASAARVLNPEGALFRWLQRRRNRSLQKADGNAVIGMAMAQRLRDEGADPQRICILPNWAVHPELPDADERAATLRAAWNIGPDQFVLCYSGNMGRAHQLNGLIDAARQLPDVVFLFIGDGPSRTELMAAAKHLPNVRFLPYQPRRLLAATLRVADMHVVALRAEMEGLVMPSKLYGVLAVARPVLALAPVDSELSRLIIDHECGLHAAPDDAASIAAAVAGIAADPARQTQMRAAAKAYHESDLSQSQAVARWKAFLESVSVRASS